MRGVKAGVFIAAGGDTGVFKHGENSLEVECMIETGMSVEGILGAATVGGFEACGGHGVVERLFGVLKEGWCADVVAIRGVLSREAFASTIRDVVLDVKNGEVIVDKL